MNSWDVGFARSGEKIKAGIRVNRRPTMAGLIALLGICALHASPAQAAANEFWIAPPDVTDLNNPPGGEPLYLIVASGDAPSTVTVDVPANGSFTPIVVNIAAFDSARIVLTAFKAQLETRPTNTIANTGLHVTASAPVTARYEVANNDNADMWMLQGPNAAGQEFIIPLQKHAPFNNEASFAAPHQAFASFDAVGTQNDTLVTIYSPVPIDGHPALQQFSLTLNRGQTYSAAYTGSNWSLPSTHPSGAVLIADKPVVVSIKDDSIHNPSGGCYNLVGDQLVPVSALGLEYVAIKGALNNTGDESVVLVATQNNTQITINGAAAPTITLFSGEYYRYDMDYLSGSADNAVYLHASKPVYATHYSGFGCQMGMALLPPLDRAGSRAVDVVRSDAQTFYIFVLVPSAAVNGFSISGAGTATINPALFVTVPGTSGTWKVARIPYNTTEIPVDVPLHISNSIDRFILGVLTGGAASGARYGYVSDFLAPTSMTLSLTPAPGTLPEPGGPVIYAVHAQNDGIAPIQLDSLSDSHVGDLNGQGCVLPQTLGVGVPYDCSFSTSVSGNAGDSVSTTVIANGSSLATPVSAMATGNIILSDVLPTLAIEQHALPAVALPGSSIMFVIGVENTGSAEAILLSTLADDVNGNLDGQGDCVLPQTIAPGNTYTCAYAATVNGALGSQVTNTLSASASDDEANIVNGQATTTVTLDSLIFADGFEL